MGCCASQTTNTAEPAKSNGLASAPGNEAPSQNSVKQSTGTPKEQSAPQSSSPPPPNAPPKLAPKPPTKTAGAPMSAPPPASPPVAAAAPGPAPAPAPKPAAAPAPFAAPAPGVKNIRSAYSGKGWAPPQKEWESNEKRKGDKTRIEVEDEWDEDGNLRRTTIKHITTPDWKVKKEKTIEIIPKEEAEKMGLGRK
mmetsp:Transcript_21187/g.39557  ORF Transcript_21187/g.39557 Transcript_21187/m.39557 type:complete len:195 (-) Transcript_21187:1942-2526(-)